MKELSFMRIAAVVAAIKICLCVSAQDENRLALIVKRADGFIETVPTAMVNSLWFSDDGDMLYIATADTIVSRPTSIVEQVCFDEQPAVATISFNDGTATIVNPYFCNGVDISIDGGKVIVTNTNEAEELTFSLNGSTSCGSFTYNGTYKATIQLNGVSIKSPNGSALNIQCGKRIALNLKKGTENYLEDTEGDHKATLYCKGHLEVDKAGSLTVKGNVKHAISTKEYMQIKNGTGTITVAGAKGDGIHAGQYFQMNGGVVNISNVEGDGIQAEATNDKTDELNGQMIINGGEINITATADECDAMKADAAFTITTKKSVPVLNIITSGKGSKGIKTDGELIIGTEDASEDPVLNITTTGGRTAGSNTGTNPGGWWPGGRPGGGGRPGEQSSGSSSKAIKAQGAAIIYGGMLNITTGASGAEGLESKTSVRIAGGQHYFKCYDDCINSKGNIIFDGGITVCYSTGNDAVDSNAGKAGAITIGDGVVLAYTSKGSPEEGLDCDNNSYIRITGSGYAISAGGAQGGGSSSSTITGATQGYAFVTSTIRYTKGNYYTLADAQGNNLITYSLDASVNSTLNLFTAKGMTKGATYTLKSSTSAPTDPQASYHGIYLCSTAKGTTNVASFTAK